MAVYIPIISEFNSKGIDKAIKEFNSLGTSGAKANFALKKAALPAAAAVGALALALGDATKGALEDDAAQNLLANTLRKTTGATDAQIKANEDFITTQGRLLGITDDELRPVLGRLAKATGSVTEAQKLATQAMDISAQTGKPLSTVVSSLEKAYGGNTAALAKLAPEYRQMIKDGATFEEVMAEIGKTTGGAAAEGANTAAGKFKTMKVQLDEAKESIGAALLPALEKLMPYLTKFGNWARDNTGILLTLASVIGVVALAVLAYNAYLKISAAYTIASTIATAAFNAVMALNPVTLVVIAVVALIAALVIAYKKFEGFREIVDKIFGVIGTVVKTSIEAIKSYFEKLVDFYKGIFNNIAKLWNNTIGKLSFTVPSWVPGIGGKGFDVPDIPLLANGGIVTSPTLAMIGEAGPEAVIPLDRLGGMAGGNTVTINVNGGDPQQVVNALRRYMQVNGSVPIRVS